MRSLSITLTVAAMLAGAGSVVAQPFTIDQPVGNDTFGSRSTGQSFTPGVGVAPVLSGQTMLPLSEMTIYHGNSGSATPSAATWLNIYDGDPAAGGVFLASSNNTVDTIALTFRTPMTWTFDAVPLNVSTQYRAIFSSTDVAGNLDLEVTLETEPRNGPPGPDSYPGGSGLIANIAPHPNSVDSRFQIVFDTAGFRLTGDGCPGSAGNPLLSATLLPRIGQGFPLAVNNLSPGAAPFLIVGFFDSIWLGLPLPVALDTVIPFTDPSCTVRASVDVVLPLAVAGTSGTTTITVPNRPILVGQELFLQGWQLEPGLFSLTAKGCARIGG
ncbi:MAG: hypothetical protein AAF196_16850 [Planctomycetota bacterium]